MKSEHKIIINQTGSLTDVVLTLPLAAVLKQHWPDTYIVFLVRKEAVALVLSCCWTDEYITTEQLAADSRLLKSLEADIIIHASSNPSIAWQAFAAGISSRVGDQQAWYNWFLCNKWVNLKNIKHDGQRYTWLARAFKANTYFSADVLPSLMGLTKTASLPTQWASLLAVNAGKFVMLVQPQTPEHRWEWPLSSYLSLCQQLSPSEYVILLVGTTEENQSLQQRCPEIFQLPQVKNLMGQISDTDIIPFIKAADAFIGGNTDWLHVAAALEKFTLGIYAPLAPTNPVRQKPIGIKASFMAYKNRCNDCSAGQACKCIEQINVQNVVARVKEWTKHKANYPESKPYFAS